MKNPFDSNDDKEYLITIMADLEKIKGALRDIYPALNKLSEKSVDFEESIEALKLKLENIDGRVTAAINTSNVHVSAGTTISGNVDGDVAGGDIHG